MKPFFSVVFLFCRLHVPNNSLSFLRQEVSFHLSSIWTIFYMNAHLFAMPWFKYCQDIVFFSVHTERQRDFKVFLFSTSFCCFRVFSSALLPHATISSSFSSTFSMLLLHNSTELYDDTSIVLFYWRIFVYNFVSFSQ